MLRNDTDWVGVASPDGYGMGWGGQSKWIRSGLGRPVQMDTEWVGEASPNGRNGKYKGRPDGLMWNVYRWNLHDICLCVSGFIAGEGGWGVGFKGQLEGSRNKFEFAP